MTGNRVEMVVDGHRILPSLLADIEAAESFVHVAMFLFFRDPIGEEVAAALSRKARAGVKVRVLLNIEKTAMGDPFSTGEKQMMDHDPNVHDDPLDVRPLCESMRAAGAEVLDTNIDYDAEPAVDDARLRSLAAQIRDGISIDDLHVDHRKLVIIDGRVGYCGGANIGAQYMHHVPFDPQKDAQEEGDERKKAGLAEPWWKWHDSLTRFEGPVVLAMDAHFRDRFVLDGGGALGPPEMVAAAPGASRGELVEEACVYCNEPNDRPNDVRALYVRLIGEARRSIFLENPYLYQPAIVEALVAAKKANPELEVVLIVPAGKHNDNAFAQDAQEHEYARYLDCGIEVHEYQHHFTHLKIAVFDERWSIHGSTNLNCRSLEDDKDFELVVLVDDEPVARWILENVRDVDRRHARRIGEGDLHGTIAALRRRVRDPRTLLMLAKRLL
jgi:cardiolipin synthase